MAQDRGDFLRRWSRRKQDAAAQAAAETPASSELPPLPSPDSLTFESDFKAFMQAKVEEGVKRAALKKLFSDPRFNVMDGLDTYIDDYSKDDPIPQAMLAQLEHAKSTLFGREEEKPKEQTEPEKQDVAQAAEAPKKEEDGAAG
jgi:hypothetical protein